MAGQRKTRVVHAVHIPPSTWLRPPVQHQRQLLAIDAIFVGFGINAPRNAMVAASFLICAVVIAARPPGFPW
jgi:hypothetical protein